ncbi:UNVERIFIED_CONTAM: hypothetical protein RMT77_009240 [Armadillidium vulgare]
MVNLGCFVNKVVIAFFSVLIIIVGLIVIAIGSVTINRQTKYLEQFSEGKFAFPIVALIFGIFITLNGFCGLCGVVGNNKTLLILYVIAGTILFIGELVAGIFVLSSPGYTVKKIKAQMDKGFGKYGKYVSPEKGKPEPLTEKEEEEKKFRNIINKLQTNVRCCGLDSYEDWKDKYKAPFPPYTCCKTQEPCNTNNTDLIFKDGCYQKTLDLIGGAVSALGFLAIFLAVLQLLLIFMALCVVRTLKFSRVVR